MVITDLDKRWCRWQTAEWIADGKLKIEPCAVCGNPDSYVVHLDWSNPVRIKWLCKTHRGERLLSALQRTLLHQALRAFESQAIDGQVTSFRRSLKGISDPRERASRRAARGLALKRLIKRGLLERCGYGLYRLTRAGVQTARRLAL
jgi:hypothetical protein